MTCSGAPGTWLRVAGLLAALVVATGCPFGDPNQIITDPNAIINGSDDPLTGATKLNLSGTDKTLQFRGALNRSGDVAVYELGSFAAGDRLRIDVQRTSGNLDATMALFDNNVELIAYNDDRTPDASDTNPLLDIVLRADTPACYLAITSYPGDVTTGGFTATVRVQRGGSVPAATGQVVLLDWDGGASVVVPNVGVFDLPVFSATQVGLSASDTEAFKARVQAVVEQRYTGYNLIVLNTDDDGVPAAAHTTVYFGSRSSRAFAISEQIDTYNADAGDDSIIFTESFAEVFPRATLEQMATAVGNTVAHEVGHLLGLVHTAACDELMDTTCYNERLLTAQEFGTAPLDSSVFPWGMQDAREILGWILGFVSL